MMIAKMMTIPMHNGALALSRLLRKHGLNATMIMLANKECYELGCKLKETEDEQRGRPDTKKNDLTENHACSAFQEMQLHVHLIKLTLLAHIPC